MPPQGMHFIWKLCRYCKKLPLRGSWRTNASLRGFARQKQTESLFRSATLSKKVALQMLFPFTTPSVKKQLRKIRRFSSIAIIK